MAALTEDRNTEMRSTGDRWLIKVEASTVIYNGSLVSVNSAGFAIPAADTATTKCVGVADGGADNSSGANGDVSVCVKEGTHKWENSAGSALDQSNVGRLALVEDDQTVAASTTNSIVAGYVREIDADGGVWVTTRTSGVG